MTTSPLLLALLLHPNAWADTFSWASTTQLHGTSEAEMKVTDYDLDHAGPEDGGGA